MDSNLQIDVDAATRTVFLTYKPALGKAVRIPVPFMYWKDVTAGVLAAEVEGEKKHAQRDNGTRIVRAGG